MWLQGATPCSCPARRLLTWPSSSLKLRMASTPVTRVPCILSHESQLQAMTCGCGPPPPHAGQLKLEELRRVPGIEAQIAADQLNDLDEDEDGLVGFDQYLATYAKPRKVRRRWPATGQAILPLAWPQFQAAGLAAAGVPCVWSCACM